MSTPKNVLITGVGGYIGSAVAARFIAAGYEVWGIDRVAPTKVPFDGHFIQADLGSLDSKNPLSLPVDRLDHVLHLAGGALPAEVESEKMVVDPEIIAETFRMNFSSAVEVISATRTLVPSGGSILLTSSINALGSYSLPIYSAAKAALHGLVASLGPELKEEGIRLNVAALGTIRHPGVEHLHRHQTGHFERLAATTTDGVLLTPQTLSERLLDLAENSDDWGNVVIIDKGQLAHQQAALGR